MKSLMPFDVEHYYFPQWHLFLTVATLVTTTCLILNSFIWIIHVWYALCVHVRIPSQKSHPLCVNSSTFMYTNGPDAASIHHLIIQLFVKLADLLLIFLPLLLRDMNHNGRGNWARAAGAADVRERLLGFGRHQGDVLRFWAQILWRNNILTYRQGTKY